MEESRDRKFDSFNDEKAGQFNTLANVLKEGRYIATFDELKKAFGGDLTDLELILLLLDLNSTDILKYLINEDERFIKVIKNNIINDNEDLENVKSVLINFKTRILDSLDESQG